MKFPHAKTGEKGGEKDCLMRQGLMVSAWNDACDVLLRRRA
jgi:hypothetical protein